MLFDNSSPIRPFLYCNIVVIRVKQNVLDMYLPGILYQCTYTWANVRKRHTQTAAKHWLPPNCEHSLCQETSHFVPVQTRPKYTAGWKTAPML